VNPFLTVKSPPLLISFLSFMALSKRPVVLILFICPVPRSGTTQDNRRLAAIYSRQSCTPAFFPRGLSGPSSSNLRDLFVEKKKKEKRTPASAGLSYEDFFHTVVRPFPTNPPNPESKFMRRSRFRSCSPLFPIWTRRFLNIFSSSRLSKPDLNNSGMAPFNAPCLEFLKVLL